MVSVAGTDDDGDDVPFVDGGVLKGAEREDFCALGEAFCEGLCGCAASEFDVPSDPVTALGVCVADVPGDGEPAFFGAFPCDDGGALRGGVGCDAVCAHGAGDPDRCVGRVCEDAQCVGTGPAFDEVVVGCAGEFPGEQGLEFGGAVAEVVAPREEMFGRGVVGPGGDGLETLNAGLDEVGPEGFEAFQQGFDLCDRDVGAAWGDDPRFFPDDIIVLGAVSGVAGDEIDCGVLLSVEFGARFEVGGDG